jgi:hypothetical protein
VYDEIAGSNRAPLDTKHLSVAWSEGNPVPHLDIRAETKTEFDVGFAMREDSYTLWAEGWHDEFVMGGDPTEDARLLLARVRMLLDGRARLCVRYAGRMPYRWTLVVEDEEGWRGYFDVTGLLFYNYFGRRTTREKINRRLEAEGYTS